MDAAEKLNNSLEPHLHDALVPLLPLLPETISAELASFLNSTTTSSPNIIPYNVLLKISKWARSPDGCIALQQCSPPLDPKSYTMVSLLAGTQTSPERKFPAHIPKNTADERRKINDERKAISNVVNALFSIAGSGFATWWAAGRTGWNMEWRVLFALFVAFVVAFAEMALYMIWHMPSTQEKTRLAATTKRPTLMTEEGGDTQPVVDEPPPTPVGLRQRNPQKVRVVQ